MRDNAVVTDVEESAWSKRRSRLQSKYEQIAWDLFATWGFNVVTVDEIAEAAGISARTVYRYFPNKEDCLLQYTRRGTQELAEMIASPSPNPLQTVWQVIRQYSLESPPDVGTLTLWRRAAADAPEIHPRVRGERVQELTEIVTAYLAKSMGAIGSDDPTPRLLAWVVVGVGMAVIELWGRSGLTLSEILDPAELTVPDLIHRGGSGAP